MYIFDFSLVKSIAKDEHKWFFDVAEELSKHLPQDTVNRFKERIVGWYGTALSETSIMVNVKNSFISLLEGVLHKKSNKSYGYRRIYNLINGETIYDSEGDENIVTTYIFLGGFLIDILHNNCKHLMK